MERDNYLHDGDDIMEFRIADTFTDSLARLNGEEQKAVKTTAFDLQLNPLSPGMKFHKLDRAKDKNFWSVKVNRDIRVIVHKTNNCLLLCYVDHHDAAYNWAERRKIEAHPKTGAAQIVEIREMIREISIPRYVVAQEAPLFQGISDEELLRYGVPVEWLGEVRKADEDYLLELAEHLPGEAAEALLSLAIGVTPKVEISAITNINPFDHPDAQRRFRVVNNIEELERALNYPWEKWTIFLHPNQRQMVEKSYRGPVRISGSAGTGKTIVALHRAVFLARINPDSRVLLTTFSSTLANALKIKLQRLIGNEPRIGERLEVYDINEIGQRLYKLNFSQLQLASKDTIRELIDEASQSLGLQKFRRHFLIAEWEEIIDAWQLHSWEAYRDVVRLGRKTRLTENQRKQIWLVFERVYSRLEERKLITQSSLYNRLASLFSKDKHSPFEVIIVDEAQDVTVAQLRFLAALGAKRPNGLFFTGDLGQRIFQQPFSWKALGVDIRGRSKTLKINYRTSHQIRMQADQLLAPEMSDLDGNMEDRRGTVSVFNGPKPTIMVLDDINSEAEIVSQWLIKRLREDTNAHEIGVFVRSLDEIERACAAVKKAGLPFVVIDESFATKTGHVSISSMHLAKGLEYRAVVVMACDDEVIPLQARIETVADDADLEEVYNTERHLLYVACTRARDHLLVTSVDPASEFLEDLCI